MALNISTKYPGQSAAPDASYPYGSGQNITVPGDGTGTPWEKEIMNDWFGFFQRILLEASIAPSGAADTVLASDYFDALDALLTVVAERYVPDNTDKLLRNDTSATPGDAYIGKGYQADQFYGNSAVGNQYYGYIAIGKQYYGTQAVGHQYYGSGASGGQYYGLGATGSIEMGSTAGSHATKKLISGVKETTFEEIIDTVAAVVVGAWQTPTLLNGWAGNTNSVRYRLSHGGSVLEILGRMDPTSATGAQFMLLPAAYRPVGISGTFYTPSALSSATADSNLQIGVRSTGEVFCWQQNSSLPTGSDVYVHLAITMDFT